MARSLAAETSATAPVTPGPGVRLRRFAVPALSLLALFALWQISAMLAGNPRLMPPPSRVLAKILADSATGELPWNLALTLLRVAASFAIAMTVGVALGIVMGRVRLADELGQPWLVFFLNLPALVTIILCYIWIGLVETAALTAVALNKIPNVVVTVREGARALDPGLLEMAEVFRVPRGRRLRHVVLPQLYPYLIGAARSGLALIWKIVLVVELLGRSNGVGFQLGVYFQLFDVAGILAYALSFIVVVQLIEWGIMQPLERRAGQWRR
ncbi:MAG: ABC transporter permease [Geminicoccaceae bacterium]